MTPYTPSELCAATEAFVNGSAAYEDANFLSRDFVNLLTVGACFAIDQVSVTASLRRNASAIAVYDNHVALLVHGGWLTATQAANLDAAAGDL